MYTKHDYLDASVKCILSPTLSRGSVIQNVKLGGHCLVLLLLVRNDLCVPVEDSKRLFYISHVMISY